MKHASDLEYGHRGRPDVCVLDVYQDNTIGLWVERKRREDGTYAYTINDDGQGTELTEEDDIDRCVAEWRHAVGADEPPDTRCTYCDAPIEDGTECALCAARA